MTPHWMLKRTLFEGLLGVDVTAVLSDGLAKLAAQGSPAQIAHYLQREGVTGFRGQAYQCPVAHYLGDQLGVPDAVLVVRGGTGVPLMGITMMTPPEVTGFVEDFDGGQFNELLPWCASVAA